MLQTWRRVTFLHWRYDAHIVQALLPDGLTVDTCEDAAWVGLVPFEICNLRLPFLRAIPWVSSFPETNVRTYVFDREGRRGVWFFSLDADRLAAVVGARTGYRLPYQWARMRVSGEGAAVHYESVRNGLLSAGPATSVIDIEAGERLDLEALTTLEIFVTARFRLFTTFGGQLGHADIEHQPWPLARARVLHLEETMVQAAGLPAPTGDPLVHYADRVDVRVGAPELEVQKPVPQEPLKEPTEPT